MVGSGARILDHTTLSVWNRRQTLKLLWGAGAAALLSEEISAAATVANCAITTPNVTEGPYWVEEQLFRSDIRTDPATGIARKGLPLTLTLTVVNSTTNCTALAGAYVDVWHCDAIGIYSDEASYNPGGGTGNVVTSGQKFLRGYQITDTNGQVTFTTIYPGWYSGRTIHIHVRVRTYDGATALTNYTTQVFFDDTITNTVLTQAPYNTRTSARDTTNANDMVYNVANNTLMLATLTASGTGYAAAMTVDLAAQTSTAVTPKIAPNAIVSAASGAVGAAPGSWVSIFGTNLSPSTYVMASSDVVSSYMPTKMQGVSVQIDGVAAYMYYVSAEQINVLVPADSKTGTVAVTVTSANGTSSAANVTLQTLLPGLFVQGKYVLAVRVSDSAIINGTGAAVSGYTTAAAAKAGDVLEIYGTGFGPTTTTIAPGLIFTGAYPTTNTVTMTIGGIAVPVSFAGLVGPGLYQINITVPSGLTAGDNAIVATVGGVASQASGLINIAAS
jgi:uncharacterized protein (TIGR03437 family)